MPYTTFPGKRIQFINPEVFLIGAFDTQTKIELISGRRKGETDSDKYRPVSTRTLKKVPFPAANTDTERQGTTAKSLAPKP